MWLFGDKVFKEIIKLKWGWALIQYDSVQFSCSVVSDFLRPHGLQHASFPCPSPTPRACSNSCPSSWWCHPAISSSVVPFSSCLQSFSASGSFQMSQFFTSGGQSSFIDLIYCFLNLYYISLLWSLIPSLLLTFHFICSFFSKCFGYKFRLLEIFLISWDKIVLL